MKKALLIFTVAITGLFLTGCKTSTLVSDLMTPALAAGGAAAGLYAGKDEGTGTQLAYTLAGGTGGFLIGQFIANGFAEEKAKEFRLGYDLGRSNSAKEVYWMTQKLHEAKNQPDSPIVYYRVPAQYPADGVNRVPGSAVMPVVESKN